MEALIALLPGDGIGPEVTRAGEQILRAVAERFGHRFEMHEALIGGAAIDARESALPPDTLELCTEADAVLLGAVGGPKWSDPRARIRPEQGLLDLRSALGVFANLRPVKPLPELYAASAIRTERLEGTDLLVVRELTGGIYFGEKHREAESASDLCRYTRAEIERIVRVAAGLARGRRGRLTSVDKANVLETSRLWREVATEILVEEYADVELQHILVDAAAMHLISRPADFDVIVTENMFGDILTDEASMLSASLGMLPSASLGAGTRGLYEPIHGSAPDIAGQDTANPCAMIGSVAMLLRYSLGLEQEADLVEGAIARAIGHGARTADIVPRGHAFLGTRGMTAAVIERLDD